MTILPELRLNWNNTIFNLSKTSAGYYNMAELVTWVPSTDGKEKIVINLNYNFSDALNNNRQALMTLTKMIAAVNEYNAMNRGYPVYLEFRLKDTENFFRSPVVKMEYSHLDNDLLGARLASEEIPLQVNLVRLPYWEDTSLVDLVGSTNSGSQVNPITIDNVYDAGSKDNRITIDPSWQTASNARGTLPTPYIITITNTNASPTTAVNQFTKIYVGANIPPAPSLNNFNVASLPAYQFAGAGSLIADTGSAHGNYYRIIPSTSLGSLFTTPLDASTAYGQYYRIFIRFADVPANTTYIRFYLLDNEYNVVLWYSDLFKCSSGEEIQNFGAIRLPAVGYSSQGYTLACWGLDTVGTFEVHIDSLYLVPSDFYREYIPIKGTNYAYLDAQDYLYDDQSTGDLYVYNASTAKKIATFKGYGDTLLYIPSIKNMLTFLWEDKNLQSDKGKQLQVKLQVRLRRLSLEYAGVQA